MGGRYVLTTGGLGPDNGALDLLEAHATMVQEQAALADVHLVITGDDADVDSDHVAAFTRRADDRCRSDPARTGARGGLPVAGRGCVGVRLSADP